MVTPSVPVNMVGKNSVPGQISVLKLLRSLGAGHRLLMQYKSAEAVEAFNALPCQHQQTPWVLTQMGKAHFEMVNYNEARYFFEWSLEQDPNRVEGLEWYSTVLWHMKKEVRNCASDYLQGCSVSEMVLLALLASSSIFRFASLSAVVTNIGGM
jgi:hypothetical protein